ncbi:MAG: IscS subfamily cysteine desulfurase [Solibacillus sp.]
MIYLDYAATAPMSEVALQSYVEVAQHYFGNSSSLHDVGGQAQHYVEQARKVIAQKLGVSTDGIIFTASGTEGNLLAILSLAKASTRGKHIITSKAEHTSVHAAMNILEEQGYEVTKIDLLANGAVNVQQIEQAIRSDTSIISIQHINSEIGVIQPIEQIARIARREGVLMHTDCVQSFCKQAIQSFSNAVDAITVSAHKIGGPKGCGAIYINPVLNVRSLTPGVTHERGLRGGTVDTPAVVAFAVATEQYVYDETYYQELRQQLIGQLPKQYKVIQCNEQMPTICSLFCENYEGQYILLKLNEVGICISTGSACDIRSDAGTKAILAMGYTTSDARKFARISFGPATTSQQIDELIVALKRI